MRGFVVGLFLVASSAVLAEEQEIKLESREDAVDRIDKGSIVERLRKAYQPVSIKLDGPWTVQSVSGTETWSFANGQWKCEGSTYNCADWVPVSFKFFGAKGWLGAGQPVERLSYDFSGASRSNQVRHSTDSSQDGEEVPPGEEKVHFEGKRNALEMWKWSSPPLGTFEVAISLRDYLIEKVKTSNGEESLDWAQRPGAKGLSLEKVFVDKGNEKLLFTRK